jgi:hypothetical protein
MPLPPLKLMDQSRRGVMRVLEVQVHPPVMATLAIDAGIVPPLFDSPHAVIEPSALTATKAKLFE